MHFIHKKTVASLVSTIFISTMMATGCLNRSSAQENTGNAIPSCYIQASPGQRVAIISVMTVMGISNNHDNPKWSHLNNNTKPSEDLGILSIHDPIYLNLWDKPKEAAELDVKLIKEAGFDCLSIWSMGGEFHRTVGLKTSIPYFDAARKFGMKICPDFWLMADYDKDSKGNSSDSWGNLGFLLGYLKQNYDDIWLKDDAGRRMVFFVGDTQAYSYPKAMDYSKAMDKLCSKVPRSEICLVSLTTNGKNIRPGWCLPDATLNDNDVAWFNGSDLFFSFCGASWFQAQEQFQRTETNLSASNRRFIPSALNSFAQSRDEKLTYGKKSIHESLGFMRLSCIWRKAIEVRSKYVYIATWNDQTEDHEIMPESNHGWAFWELTRYYSQWYHTDKEPKVEKEKILLFHHPQPAAGVKLPEGRLPMLDHRFAKDPDVKTTPPTDYVGVVAFLKQPATLSVQFGIDVIAKRDFPAGMHSWLIYNPRKEVIDKKWTEAYPKDSDWLSVTMVEKPFLDTQVYMNVYRGNDRIGMFRSHRPIVEAAGRSDMTTIGDVFELQ
ncbi:MAG: endo-1,3-alpha-glucanase family glycosylhydrolase [Victivallales bacterium]